MNRFRGMACGLTLALAATVAGCASGHYRIQDGNTNKVYYTTKYHKDADGAVQFTDSISHQKVSLYNAGIEELDKGQWEDSVNQATKSKNQMTP